MKNPKILPVALLLSTASVFTASGGSLQELLVQNNIRSVAFEGNLMTFRSYSGEETIVSLDDVEKLIFEAQNASGIAAPAAEKADLTVYVANGVATVKTSASVKSLSLLTIDGKTVASRPASSLPASIEVSALPNGVYLLQAECTSGEVITKKFIKQ